MNRPCPVHLDARLSDEEFEAEMSNAQDRECWAEKAARVLYAPASALTAAQNAAKDEYARRLEAEARVERLERALKECADDLAAELQARYGSIVHPAEMRRYERDMETVVNAREALEGARHA